MGAAVLAQCRDYVYRVARGTFIKSRCFCLSWFDDEGMLTASFREEVSNLLCVKEIQARVSEDIGVGRKTIADVIKRQVFKENGCCST